MFFPYAARSLWGTRARIRCLEFGWGPTSLRNVEERRDETYTVMTLIGNEERRRPYGKFGRLRRRYDCESGASTLGFFLARQHRQCGPHCPASELNRAKCPRFEVLHTAGRSD